MYTAQSCLILGSGNSPWDTAHSSKLSQPCKASLPPSGHGPPLHRQVPVRAACLHVPDRDVRGPEVRRRHLAGRRRAGGYMRLGEEVPWNTKQPWKKSSRLWVWEHAHGREGAEQRAEKSPRAQAPRRESSWFYLLPLAVRSEIRNKACLLCPPHLHIRVRVWDSHLNQ